MAAVGKRMTVGLTLPIVAGAAAAVSAFSGFESSLNSFQAVSGATADQMERVGDLAKALGNDLTLPGTSAADAAEAMTELAKGGLSVADSMDAAKSAIQLSTAAQISNADAATILADALNSFGIEGAEAGRVADLLAASANATTAEIGDMALALKASSAVAAQLGVPIEDLTTAIGLMANAGIKGSDAGTSLKTMMLALAAPTDTAAKAMQELGLQVFDAQGKMLPLPEIIDNWRTATEGLSQAQEIQAMKTIFGTDAIRAAQVVLDSAPGAWDKLAAAVTKEGAAADLAAAKSKGVSGAVDAMKSALETAAISAGEALAPAVTSLAGHVSDLANRFSELDPGVQKLIVGAGLAVAALGPMLTVVGNVTKAVGLLRGAFTALATHPILAGGALLAGLATLLLRVGNETETATRSIDTFRAALDRLSAVQDPAEAVLRLKEAQIGLADAGERVSDAQDQVRQLLARGKIDTDKYADAVSELERAQLAQERAALDVERAEADLAKARSDGQAATEAATKALQEHLDAQATAGTLTNNFAEVIVAAMARGETAFAELGAASILLSKEIDDIPTVAEVKAFMRDEQAQERIRALLAALEGIPETEQTDGVFRNNAAIAAVVDYLRQVGLIPDVTHTTHRGNPNPAQRAAQLARNAIESVPSSHHTVFTGSVDGSLASAIAAAGGAGAYGGAGGPQLAKGIRNFQGGWALVGEQGPELVLLPSGSDVFSTAETRSMLRQGSSEGGWYEPFPPQQPAAVDPAAVSAALFRVAGRRIRPRRLLSELQDKPPATGGGGPVVEQHITVNVTGPITSNRDVAADIRKALAEESMYFPSLWAGRG
jgi:TP901 family phage tail tape measure protein